MAIIGVIVGLLILSLFVGRKDKQQEQRDQDDIIDIEGTVVEEDNRDTN